MHCVDKHAHDKWKLHHNICRSTGTLVRFNCIASGNTNVVFEQLRESWFIYCQSIDYLYSMLDRYETTVEQLCFGVLLLYVFLNIIYNQTQR